MTHDESHPLRISKSQFRRVGKSISYMANRTRTLGSFTQAILLQFTCPFNAIPRNCKANGSFNRRYTIYDIALGAQVLLSSLASVF